MAKRFTDSEKFRDSWYRKLSPKHKCLWEYMLAECSLSGILELDLESASFHIGETINEKDLDVFNDRIIFLSANKIFISKFIQFQQKELNINQKAHAKIIQELEKNNIPVNVSDCGTKYTLDTPSIHLQRCTGNSIGKGSSIGNSKIEPKKLKNELDITDVPYFIKPEVWEKWIQHRKEIKKTLKPTTAEQQVKKLTEWHNAGHDVNEIILTSVGNGWQGLFEPKKEKGRKNERSTRDVLTDYIAEIEANSLHDEPTVRCAGYLRQEAGSTGNPDEDDGL